MGAPSSRSSDPLGLHMSILITGVNESIQVVLDAAPVANQLPCTASYADQGGLGGDNTVVTTGLTAVTLVASPAAGVARVINGFSIGNRDTTTRMVTINKVISGTSYQIAKVTLLTGYQLYYENTGGWRVLDTSGIFQSAGGGGGSGVPNVNGITGAVTITAGTGATVSTSGSTITIGATGGGATQPLITVNAQTASYTLALTDFPTTGAIQDIQVTNASVTNVTIPPNSSVAAPVGSQIMISQWGAGAVTFIAGAGVTIPTPAFGAATTAQYDSRYARQVSANVWQIL